MRYEEPVDRPPTRRNPYVIPGILIALLVIVLLIVISVINSQLRVVNHVSRGGLQVAYLSDPNDRRISHNLFILDLESGALTQITSSGKLGDWRWQPDGETISLNDDKDYKLLNVSTGALTNVDPKPPRWSPDGRKLVYVEDKTVKVYDPSTQQTNSLRTGNILGVPVLSPDQSTIAFPEQGTGDADQDIYLIDINGGNLRKLVANQGEDSTLIWSPDAKRVIIVGVIRDEKWGGVQNREFYIADADGKNLSKFSEDDRFASLPSWSPDGQKLLFFRDVATLCVGNTNGGDAKCMAPDQTVFAAWLPDSKRIAYIPGDLITYQPKVCVVSIENLSARKCFDAPGAYGFSLRP